jgi:hypothetical protein
VLCRPVLIQAAPSPDFHRKTITVHVDANFVAGTTCEQVYRIGGFVDLSRRNLRDGMGERDEMHRRYAKKNIPIELLRALVTIVDTGSYTKAADALDLTQSAISSQIARLGQLLGGSIFAKGRGNICAAHARHERRASHLCRAQFGAAPFRHRLAELARTPASHRYLRALFGEPDGRRGQLPL